MIPFNKPLITGLEEKFVQDLIRGVKHCGDGGYTKKCSQWLENHIGTKRALLTTSCTHSIEMAAILLDIFPGDEIIMPSYTFVSSANPFVLRGAKVVFVDINPNTMNIDENVIEQAITDKTKAVVVVHYAGISCDMDEVIKIAKKHNIYVIEDAAQGLMSYYKNKPLGSIGDIGCVSFHETKNYQCGEGGAIFINNESLIERAEIIREKGTNRSQFFRGEIDKYTWVDLGSSYLPNEITAAFLYAQLNNAGKVKLKRRAIWERYYQNLKSLELDGLIKLPYIPQGCNHNAHIFYIKANGVEQRQEITEYLKSKQIQVAFHYVPLHSAIAGKKFAEFRGEDNFTTIESEKLLRLPLYYDLTLDEVDMICREIKNVLGVAVDLDILLN